MRLAVSFFVFALLGACTASPPEAEQLIDNAIDAHGMAALDNAVVTFDFRGDRFVVDRQDGVFSYTRIYEDVEGRTVQDELSNEGLTRMIDGEPAEIPEDEIGSATTAVNSVVYFALLPYFLQDPAVQARYLGGDTIRDTPYHVVEVTFVEEGGGVDHDDRFVYWFNAEAGTMDYLAYYFHTNDGGSRFREATNVHTVEGIRFQDYGNYVVPELTEDAIEEYGRFVGTDELEYVSDVDIERVGVELR